MRAKGVEPSPDTRDRAIMPEKHNIRALLLALQELYSRMVLRVLHHRMSSQRKASAAETEHDIAAMLSDHIDELAVSREINIQSMPEEQIATEGSIQSQIRPNTSIPKTGSKFTGLSKYFRRRPTTPLMQPHVGAKIKKRAWDHIYSSLRLAREGDAETARIHANIADLAMKESANYMSAEEYSRFVADVREQLQRAKDQDKADT